MKDDWMEIFWETCYEAFNILAIVGVVLFFVLLIASLFASLFIPRIEIPYWWR